MSKKRKVLLTALFVATIILILLYFIFVRGFYAGSDKVVGEYTGSASIEKFIQYDAWKIGENKYGQPIFVDYKKALQFLQEEYRMFWIRHTICIIKSTSLENLITVTVACI